MKYTRQGSALLFVIMITSTCALYLRYVIRNAYYATLYAQMRTEHVYNEYVLYGFRSLATHLVAQRYDELMSFLKEGGQTCLLLQWPLKEECTESAVATICKKYPLLLIKVEHENKGVLRRIGCTIQRIPKTSGGGKSFKFHVNQCTIAV